MSSRAIHSRRTRERVFFLRYLGTNPLICFPGESTFVRGGYTVCKNEIFQSLKRKFNLPTPIPMPCLIAPSPYPFPYPLDPSPRHITLLTYFHLSVRN